MNTSTRSRGRPPSIRPTSNTSSVRNEAAGDGRLACVNKLKKLIISATASIKMKTKVRPASQAACDLRADHNKPLQFRIYGSSGHRSKQSVASDTQLVASKGPNIRTLLNPDYRPITISGEPEAEPLLVSQIKPTDTLFSRILVNEQSQQRRVAYGRRKAETAAKRSDSVAVDAG